MEVVNFLAISRKVGNVSLSKNWDDMHHDFNEKYLRGLSG